MELFCKYLDHEKFDIYVVSRIHKEKLAKRIKVELGALLGVKPAKAKKRLWAGMNARVPAFQQILGQEKVIFVESDGALRQTLLALKPDILHVWYSGNPEPPTSDEEIVSKIPATITTNAFEIANTAPAHRHVKKMYFMSQWLLDNQALWAKGDARAGVFYCPIEKPLTNEDLRAKLGIPKDAFVIGRVGRADPGIHDSISLKAFQQIQNDKSYFLALAAPDNMVAEARELGLRNFIPLQPMFGADLSRFYNTIDVLAHARRDGETFGCNIAEAMMHSKPVVSHFTQYMNAQQEVIGDTGFVVADGDWKTYAKHLERLRDDENFRTELAHRAKSRALEQFEVERLAKKLEAIYLESVCKN